MTKQIAPLTQRQAWKALEAHHTNIREFHLRKLFADDPKRGERMTAEALGLYLDYSKNRITDETLKLLLQLAEESGLRERIDAIVSGASNTLLAEGSRRKRSLARRSLRALGLHPRCYLEHRLRRWRGCGAAGPRRARQDG